MPLHALTNPGAPHDLRLGGLEMTAFSISAVASYVMVPSFDACFDLGHCPIEASRLRHVFLTHVHQDHSGGVHRHVSLRTMHQGSPSAVYVPAASAEALRELLRAWGRLEQMPDEQIDVAAIVRPVAPGDEVRLSQRLRVEVFDVVHRIASVGYTVHQSQKKLRPEFVGVPGAEIARAVARGEQVNDVTEAPVFTYVGDSTIETLRRRPQLGQSQVLFLEATHLPGTERALSAFWGHTHLDELVELYAESPGTLASPHIVLKHFSTRYGRDEIERAREVLPPGLRERVTLLV